MVERLPNGARQCREGRGRRRRAIGVEQGLIEADHLRQGTLGDRDARLRAQRRDLEPGQLGLRPRQVDARAQLAPHQGRGLIAVGSRPGNRRAGRGLDLVGRPDGGEGHRDGQGDVQPPRRQILLLGEQRGVGARYLSGGEPEVPDLLLDPDRSERGSVGLPRGRTVETQRRVVGASTNARQIDARSARQTQGGRVVDGRAEELDGGAGGGDPAAPGDVLALLAFPDPSLGRGERRAVDRGVRQRVRQRHLGRQRLGERCACREPQGGPEQLRESSRDLHRRIRPFVPSPEAGARLWIEDGT